MDLVQRLTWRWTARRALEWVRRGPRAEGMIALAAALGLAQGHGAGSRLQGELLVTLGGLQAGEPRVGRGLALLEEGLAVLGIHPRHDAQAPSGEDVG